MNLHYLKWALVTTLVLFPPALMVLPKGGNAGFYVLLLCSLFGLACRFRPMGKGFWQLIREYWPINMAMLGLLCAILLNHLAFGQIVLKTYDMPLRLALFPVIFWGLLLLPIRELKNLQWGLVAGTIVGAVALYIETDAAAMRPLIILTTPLIPFTDITFVMAALVLLSIGWSELDDKWAIAIKILVGTAGLYASYLSQTRGAWIAIPVFLFLVILAMKAMPPKKKMSVFVLALILLAWGAYSNDIVQSRVAVALSDLKHYMAGDDLNTSLGQRFQLWRASWILFKENPLFGVGLERFHGVVQELVAQHMITQVAAAQPHSHNDLLFHMASLGLFGALAAQAVYFVPAFYFARTISNPDRETRTVAAMGLMLTLGFFIFGLTDVMFYWSISYTFYSIVLAALFAHLVKRTASSSGQPGENTFQYEAGLNQSDCHVSASID